MPLRRTGEERRMEISRSEEKDMDMVSECSQTGADKMAEQGMITEKYWSIFQKLR